MIDVAKSAVRRLRRAAGSRKVKLKQAVEISRRDRSRATSVDNYWGRHTVNSVPFKSARESEKYLRWRASVYPKLEEFMELYGEHDGEVVLDYGCGPGNDLVGFAIYTTARQVIGIDVSEQALELANHRLALHNVDSSRVRLILSSDSLSDVPLDDDSVDYINCSGVLHHTTDPQSLLREFYRVLKPGARACVMVYNCDSLWLHLYTAYERMIVQGMFKGESAYEAFSKNTDGVECPIAACYRGEEFCAMCREAGFECEYVGGYLSDTELSSYRKYGQAARRDDRLADEHKSFIANLAFDGAGLPQHRGKYAGIGGVYRLFKGGQ